MLSEFYKFIARRIFSFFQSQSDQGLLLTAESFCLKLDDEDMVKKVSFALINLLDENGCKGAYNLSCLDGTVYTTYTLIAKNDEVIIAIQDDNITSDFLGATLRNAANEEKKPLLLITSNPIDSAMSGTRDMAAAGMPFYPASLNEEIISQISTSDKLTKLEKAILKYEIERREEDVFSDKTSLYEYKELLAIISEGAIDENIFPGFRLFYVDGKSEYPTLNEKQIEKEIRTNNEWFERIDRSIRFGNLERDLNNDFDDKFITLLVKQKNRSLEQWSLAITYQQVLNSIDKKSGDKRNPLSIEKSNITAYGELPLEALQADSEMYIRNEGSQKTKKRTRSILLFNSANYHTVTIKVECNIKVKTAEIKVDTSSFDRQGNDLIFKFDEELIAFHRIQLKDDINNITYIFKICILELSPQFLIPAIKNSFVVNYKDNKKKCAIKLLGVGTDISFNQSGSEVQSEKIKDNEDYVCDYKTRLHLYASEEELANCGSGINISLSVGSIRIPFLICPDQAKSIEITGKHILRDKYSNKMSFTLTDAGLIQRDLQEYFAKGILQKEIVLENTIVSEKILFGEIENFQEREPKINPLELHISKELEEAYRNLLDVYKELGTVPTLAYVGETKILFAAKRYVEAFVAEFNSIEDHVPLTEAQQDALSLGVLLIGPDVSEIYMTPLHPLNIAYQLALLNESWGDETVDVIVEKLNSVYLLPYIQRNKTMYKVSDQLFSMEWKHYALVKNRKYMGGRKYVPKLVEDKVREFTGHFRYIFDDINNFSIIINLINMGDCDEVLHGIAQYYCHAVKANPDLDKLLSFEVHIFAENIQDNAFNLLKDREKLKGFLEEKKLSIDPGTTMSDLEGILSKHVKCYFAEDKGTGYSYSHITFYEMESEVTSEVATMNQIPTGVSLNGILSGVPSSKYGSKYRTGFGSKFAERNDLEALAELYNSLSLISDTGNPYQSGVAISTQVKSDVENKMDAIYDSSNWVVFVDPKVDLDFFCEKEATSDLLIIHYSDQYTSSSGYDAITVTKKSQQYARVINEYLTGKGVSATKQDIRKIINLFNAINGDWLLRLVSSKQAIGINKDSFFSREKISIVAAIKFMLAYLKRPGYVWVPISMEEMLRVSGGVGLSRADAVLSAANLGFEKGPTSDDLLFVGVSNDENDLRVFFYPTEVKTGNNTGTVISKAFEQAFNTAKGLQNALNPQGEENLNITYRTSRNFMMQLIINSCKKMQVYHVDDSQDWDVILNECTEKLLNEQYTIETRIDDSLGVGSVVSFKKEAINRSTSFDTNGIKLFEMPETDEYGLILSSVDEIEENLNVQETNDEYKPAESVDDSDGIDDDVVLNPGKENAANAEIVKSDAPDATPKETLSTLDAHTALTEAADADQGIQICFGTDSADGHKVIWNPNDTDQIFHTNTGIIGTMGTGKTQFTKSLITQLYREQKKNVDQEPIGILIFDYKGDYNKSKQDFVDATNANVLKPFHLSFNPLALTQTSVFKPILPVHTANGFKDTLSRVFGLGPKQQNALFQCIMSAYHKYGIQEGDPSTWDSEPPTFNVVYQIYENDEDIKKNDSLAAAMDKLNTFQIFESDNSKTTSLYDLLNGVVVIDMSGYDQDIQSFVIAITLDLFYLQMQAAGSSKLDGKYRQITKMILVDEADNFMSQDFPALKKILKEGREFGVGTVLSTQFLKHFGTGEDDYSKYILTWVVHNVADLKTSDIDFVFNTEAKSFEEQKLFQDIKKLTKHHSIVKIGTERPKYIEDLPFWQLVQIDK